MATTTWSAFDDDLMPEIPGAVAGVIRHHVKLAAIEFCARAWVWVLDQGPIPVAANLAEYDWQPPSNTEVARILVAWLEKKRLTPKTRNELSALYGDYMRATGTPQHFIQDVPSKLILVPKPNEAVEKVSDHPATAEPAAQCEGHKDAQEATHPWPATSTLT